MAFLLSLVGAQTLEGLEHETLFPENERAWETLFLQGRSELERDQWLSQVPGTAQHYLNDELVAVIAAMAAPRVVVVTTLDAPGRPKQSVTHYISTVVVEACFDGKGYLLAALRSTDVMLGRLASTIGLPEQRLLLKEFELSAEQARQAVANPRTETLLKLGVPAGSVKAFEIALQGNRQRANVQVMQIDYGQVKAVHRLQALISGEGSAWLALPVNGAQVRFLPASVEEFAKTMHALIEAA
jgi:hypothetical protein